MAIACRGPLTVRELLLCHAIYVTHRPDLLALLPTLRGRQLL